MKGAAKRSHGKIFEKISHDTHLEMISASLGLCEGSMLGYRGPLPRTPLGDPFSVRRIS